MKEIGRTPASDIAKFYLQNKRRYTITKALFDLLFLVFNIQALLSSLLYLAFHLQVTVRGIL
jgi:hypothetical protein